MGGDLPPGGAHRVRPALSASPAALVHDRRPGLRAPEVARPPVSGRGPCAVRTPLRWLSWGAVARSWPSAGLHGPRVLGRRGWPRLVAGLVVRRPRSTQTWSWPWPASASCAVPSPPPCSGSGSPPRHRCGPPGSRAGRPPIRPDSLGVSTRAPSAWPLPLRCSSFPPFRGWSRCSSPRPAADGARPGHGRGRADDLGGCRRRSGSARYPRSSRSSPSYLSNKPGLLGDPRMGPPPTWMPSQAWVPRGPRVLAPGRGMPHPRPPDALGRRRRARATPPHRRRRGSARPARGPRADLPRIPRRRYGAGGRAQCVSRGFPTLDRYFLPLAPVPAGRRAGPTGGG